MPDAVFQETCAKRPAGSSFLSCQQFRHDPRSGDLGIGEAFGAAVVELGEAGVIETELVQDGGVKVVADGNLLSGLAAEVVGGDIVIGSVQPSGFAELPQAPRHPMVNTLNVIVVAWLSGLQTGR